MLHRDKFKNITKRFFVPNIDLFATNASAQCSMYVSWYPDIGCKAVDAFPIKWKDNFYAFLPFNLVGRVLRKIVDDKVNGIVVAPYWSTQSWFPNYMKLVRTYNT